MKTSLFTSALIVAGLAAIPAFAAPVGMAAHVVGSVQLEHGGAKSQLHLLQRVEDGDVVQCGANAQAVVILFNGGARFQIGAGQKATIHGAGVAGGVKLAAISGPSAKAVTLLGGSRVGATLSRKAKSFERLMPQNPGWLLLPNPRFEWLPLPGAAFYTFTLFDPYDNVVWSQRTTQNIAPFPADTLPLLEKRAYLWQLSGFGLSGKPIPESRCGLITFLSPEDATSLANMVADLENQAVAADTTPLLLLAETYRSYGVLGRTLEVLENESLRNEDGLAEAKNEVLMSLSAFTRALAHSDEAPQH